MAKEPRSVFGAQLPSEGSADLPEAPYTSDNRPVTAVFGGYGLASTRVGAGGWRIDYDFDDLDPIEGDLWALTWDADTKQYGRSAINIAKNMFATTIGDASATQFDIIHGLATRDLTVQVWRAVSPWDQVLCSISLVDTNTARLNFARAPASGELRVIVRA